jgi:KipI family sensor histidine kinase inhibitor
MRTQHTQADPQATRDQAQAFSKLGPVDGQQPAATRMEPAAPRVSQSGSGALLFDAAGRDFSSQTQLRILAMAATLSETPFADGIAEVTPGLNNLLLVFDPFVLSAEAARSELSSLWERADAHAFTGRDIDVGVVYGGSAGIDLAEIASAAGMSIESFVQMHSAASYSVACMGSYPGFAYLLGLPQALFAPRRQVPRKEVASGSVIIGGAQAGVMPCTGPSGWNAIGRCELAMFDPGSDRPCLFSPGDRVRFHIERIEA